jgi:hypothetical protein
MKKISTLTFAALVFVLPNISRAETTPVSEPQRIQQMRQEIDRLEAQCVPARGTSRLEVEKQFGAGSPAFAGKVEPKEGVSENSSLRSYKFAALGTLFVSYDQQWNVRWAHYLDPFSIKGHPGNVPVPIEVQRREVEPRLTQIRQIHSEYQKRFGLVNAEVVTAETAKPQALVELEPILLKVMQQAQPQATLAYTEGELVGQYQTQKFMVHTIYKTGAISEQSREELGPNFQGFLLKLTVQKAAYQGAADWPYGVWHRIYWDTYINEYQLPDKTGYLRLELSYGARSDTKLLSDVRRAIANYATPLFKDTEAPE